MAITGAWDTRTAEREVFLLDLMHSLEPVADEIAEMQARTVPQMAVLALGVSFLKILSERREDDIHPSAVPLIKTWRASTLEKIRGFARTAEEENALLLWLAQRLVDEGALSFMTVLNRQEIDSPHQVFAASDQAAKND